MSLNKEAFLSPVGLHGPFPVDGFGDVYVREVPSSETMFVSSGPDDDDMERSVRIIIAATCNADGSLVFDRDDLQSLLGVPAMRLKPLMELAVGYSGFGADVEAIAGNSEATT